MVESLRQVALPQERIRVHIGDEQRPVQRRRIGVDRRQRDVALHRVHPGIDTLWQESEKVDEAGNHQQEQHRAESFRHILALTEIGYCSR